MPTYGYACRKINYLAWKKEILVDLGVLLGATTLRYESGGKHWRKKQYSTKNLLSVSVPGNNRTKKWKRQMMKQHGPRAAWNQIVCPANNISQYRRKGNLSSSLECHLTLFQMAIKKGVAVRLGVIYDSQVTKKEAGRIPCESPSPAALLLVVWESDMTPS